MHLKILLPTQILLEEDVEAVNADAQNGAFGLLPQHVDFVTALVPSILSYRPADGGDEVFVAIDQGILVKCGDTVLASVRNGVVGESLETLEQTVAEQYTQLNDKEKQSRSAIARLEAGFMRGLIEHNQ